MWGQAEATFGGDGGFLNNTNSPSVGGDRQKSRRSQNIIPVTVKALLGSSDDTYRVEGFEAHVVTIVGLVTKVETSTTKMSIFLDDQTGTLECIHYVGTDGEGSNEPMMLCEGTYGRVYGSLRSKGGHKYLVLFKSAPVMDLNEITLHLVEVLGTPLKLKKLRKAEELKASGGGKSGFNNTFSNSMISANLGGPTGIGGSGDAGMGGTGGHHVAGFTSNQNTIRNIIAGVKNDEGIHRDDIIAAVKGRIHVNEVMKILEFLSNEGHVFSTIDDDHYSATDSQYL